MQVFALLKQAVNASAHNQRANWCKAAIKKTKTALKTLTHNNFKQVCKGLKPVHFELLIEHIKAAGESSLFRNKGPHPEVRISQYNVIKVTPVN